MNGTVEKSKKRVLFIGSFKTKGDSGNVGGQMFACNSLVNSELKKDFDWVLLDTTSKTNLERSFISRLYYAFLRIIKSIYFLLFKDVDVVMAFCAGGYSFLEKGLILRIAKFLNKKTIIAPRSGHLIDDVNSSEGFRTKVKRILDSCDYIICQGTYWKEYFTGEFAVPESKAVVISNWIELNSYDSQKTAVGNPMRILFLGAIDKKKGIWDLFDSIKQLRNENIIVDIAGNGPEFQKLERMIEEENLGHKINLLNWIYGEDKKKILNEADILILPSYREGCPNVILEAMASKTAIIASNVGAIPDLIKSDENGFLINPGDADAIAKYITEYIEDPALILSHSASGLDLVRANHSMAAVIPKFKKLLSN